MKVYGVHLTSETFITNDSFHLLSLHTTLGKASTSAGNFQKEWESESYAKSIGQKWQKVKDPKEVKVLEKCGAVKMWSTSPAGGSYLIIKEHTVED